MEVVGEDLDHDLHKVFLSDDVLAVDDLLEDRWQDGALVHFEIHAFELAETNEVGSDKNTKLLALHLALLAISGVTLVLKPDPELVHLDEVGEYESDAILKVAAWSHILSDGKVIAGCTAEVVAEEETSGGMLNTSAHLHDVLHDLFDGSVGYRHVNASNGDHQVKTWDDVAAVLDELVQVGEVVLAGCVGIIEIDRKVSQRIEYGHVCVKHQYENGMSVSSQCQAW